MAEKKSVTVGGTVLRTQFKTKLRDTDDLDLEQILIYLGQDGTAFHIGYREFGNGRAREPFRENVTYRAPLDGESTVISFRSVRMKVFTVSNIGIEFEFISDTDSI